ncbi:TPA: hypothetical protein SIA28_000427 [Aeromonas salmonicida]|nr:hypothetical protein [Aeromonas salmonicida]HEH9420685.1 hypothetical protein [Aeromonas salmonicida]HEH9433934.1 hypothetical protein [Aeromonas salmonicida]
MHSKWRWHALKAARWGLQHGEFFDLYDVAYQFGVPIHGAGKVMLYLRSLRYVENQAETRHCKPEPERMAARRIFIKVLAIHPEPIKVEPLAQETSNISQP